MKFLKFVVKNTRSKQDNSPKGCFSRVFLNSLIIHAQRLYKSPVYNVCKSLVRIKITALAIDAHKGFTYKAKRKGCFWRVFLNSLIFLADCMKFVQNLAWQMRHTSCMSQYRHA